MIRLRMILLSILLVFSLVVHARNSEDQPRVIYGEDERVDVIESKDPFITQKSNFVAAIIQKKYLVKLDPVGNLYQIDHPTYGDIPKLCPGERFSEQINPAMCTAFRIDDDVIMTAGHCILSQRDCDNYYFVFNFLGANDQGRYKIRGNQVYNCKKVLSRKLLRQSRQDYAILQLDRKIAYPPKGQPLIIVTDDGIREDDQFLVLGHPSGLPLKASPNVELKKNRPDDPAIIFRIKSDTFQGNSGSPVFNNSTGEVEGMLVHGVQDVVWDEKRGCNKAKVCLDDECSGEVVLKMGAIPWREALYKKE